MRVVKLVSAIIATIIAGTVVFVYVAPEAATGLFLRVERLRSHLDRKEIRLEGGLQYIYLEGGTGEPLMLLHGFGGDKDNFTRVARYLTPHFRVIIPDHIGSGESSHPFDADYAPQAQAERLRALAQALGVKSLHIGGNSMGGHIAMTYASLYPGEVKSLWLLDPSGIWSAPETEVHSIIKSTGKNPLIPPSERDFVKLLSFIMSKPPYAPRPILNVLAGERLKNRTLEQRIFAQIAADSVEERVKGLPTPALIVWGQEDRVLSAQSAQILHGLMPHSEITIMSKTGHVPMLERPEKTARDYLRFREALH